MKEKTDNIDILEELKKEFDGILKEPMGKDEMSNGNLYEYERSYELNLEEIKAVETLIAENKELKEENLHWKGQYHLLSRKIDVIPKSKIKAKIEEINKEMLNEENSLELFYRKKYCKELLQSLLGKE